MRQLGADLAGDARADLLPEPGPLRRLFARLVSSPLPGLATAGLRGRPLDEARIYEAEGITVSLSAQAERHGAKRSWTLLGLIDVDGAPPDHACQVGVLANGSMQASAAVDELGSFLASGLEPGTYDLELRFVDRLIAIEGVSVEDAE
jgi:hypothetical protein